MHFVCERLRGGEGCEKYERIQMDHSVTSSVPPSEAHKVAAVASSEPSNGSEKNNDEKEVIIQMLAVSAFCI